MRTGFSFTLLFFFALLLPANSLQAADKALRFGVFPYKSPKAMMKLFLPVAKQLEDTLGIPVRLTTAPNAQQFNQRAMAGDYDLIWTCNTCFIQTRKKISYNAIASGYPSFQGGVIVRKDSNISELSQLKGKRIAAMSKVSYAGHKFFKKKMDDIGYNAGIDYSIKFVGKLDSIIFSVAGRQYDAGIIRLDALNSSKFKQIRNQFSVLATSIDIPQFPFALKPDTAPYLVEQIMTALTGINQETAIGSSILKSLRIKGITSCDNTKYEEFSRKMLETSAETQRNTQ